MALIIIPPSCRQTLLAPPACIGNARKNSGVWSSWDRVPHRTTHISLSPKLQIPEFHVLQESQDSSILYGMLRKISQPGHPSRYRETNLHEAPQSKWSLISFLVMNLQLSLSLWSYTKSLSSPHPSFSCWLLTCFEFAEKTNNNMALHHQTQMHGGHHVFTILNGGHHASTIRVQMHRGCHVF